jgi:hypothetical protein
MATQFRKDPSARKDYRFDWSLWITSGDYISTSVFSCGACTVTSSTIVTSTGGTSHHTQCFVESGVAGSTYSLTNRITTANGRIEEKSVELKVINL